MDAFDPRDWRRAEGRGTAADGALAERALRVALAASLALFLASLAPLALVPAVFGELMFWAAAANAVAALLREEEPFAPRLGHWDEAAACLLLAQAAGLLGHAVAGG